MKTYNKIIYLLLLCGTVVFSSCEKWLDVKPQTSIKSDDLFKSEAGFKEALIGVYIGMSDAKIYGKELTFGFLDAVGQQYEISSGTQYYNSQIFNYKAINTMSIKDNIWNTQYNIIANVNNILNNIDAKKTILSPITYNVIKGELLGLRAFLHLDLMRLFGHGDLKNRPELLDKLTIPYSTNCSKEFIPQMSYRATIALIENDLLESVACLKLEDPASDDNNKPDDYYTEINTDGFFSARDDRFGYWAVQSTLARFYSWIGNDVEALKYATSVIESKSWSWVSEYNISNSEQNNRDLTFASEHLFSLRVTGEYSEIVNSYFIANSENTNTNDMLYKSYNKLNDLYEISASVGLSDYRYLYQYLSNDNKSFPLKLTQREKGHEFYYYRIPMIRVPEIYMIAIDILINGDSPDKTKALKYFNEYRKSRGIRMVYPESIDVVELNNEIIKEMRKEFVCEGQLFYFYKKKNLKTVPSTNVQMSDKTYIIPYPDDEITYGNRVQ